MLENSEYPPVLALVCRFMGSENLCGADNQQERLLSGERRFWFLAGLVEGEGSVRRSRSGRTRRSATATTFSRGSSSISTSAPPAPRHGSGVLRRRPDQGPSDGQSGRARLLHHVASRLLAARVVPFLEACQEFSARSATTTRSSSRSCSLLEARVPSNSGGPCRDRRARLLDEHERQAAPDPDRGHPQQNPQRPYARRPRARVKRWSDLHGDMESQAEEQTTWPLSVVLRGNRSA